MPFRRFPLEASGALPFLQCHTAFAQNPEAGKGIQPWRRLHWFNRFSIGQKIACGYVLAFSFAAGGAIAGLLIGNAYHSHAEQALEAVAREGDQLNDLYTVVSQAHAHQLELIALLRTPKEFAIEHEHFLKLIEASQAQFARLRAEASQSHQQDINTLIETYQTKIEAYFASSEALLEQNNPQHLSFSQLPIAQQQLLTFTNSDEAKTYDDFTDALMALTDQYAHSEQAAQGDAIHADTLRTQIIVTSLVLSSILAVVLIFLLNRAIIHPIRRLTAVSRAVVQQQDFELQAPVTSRDEIGSLTQAFNQLVQWMAQYTQALKDTQHAAQQQLAELQETHAQLSQAMQELQQTQLQLVQAEKMSSLGQLVAGVAHEINNPVNFIYGNLTHADEYVQEMLHLLQLYQRHVPQPPIEISETVEALDMAFLATDLPKVLASMKVGSERIRQIVLSLRNFSRLDGADMKAVNIHDGLDSTLMILENRLKARADRPAIQVIKSYGDLPLVECYAGQLNQVFMNLLANAIDALEEQNQSRSYAEALASPSTIAIKTELLNQDQVAIHFTDNGSGMTPETQRKLFNPFFTTKPIGKGTGMGLSISYQIVTEKHGGTLQCFSSSATGTEFIIQIPLAQARKLE